MTPEVIAARFDNRPGYRIVSFGEVGLPIFRVTVIGLTQIKKTLSPIDEFVLRAMSLGLRTVDELSGLLGLSIKVIETVLTDMISRENVVAWRGVPDEQFALTERGKRLAVEQQEIRPVEQTLPFTYDALLKRPRWLGESELFAPRDLRDREIPELRANPDRGPELHELNVRDVSQVVTLAAGRADDSLALLRITSVEKRVRLFQEAVALVYRSDDGNDVQVAFAIDGRLSELHEQAFAGSKGLERNVVFRDLLRSDRAELELDPDLLAIASSAEARSRRADAAKERSQRAAVRLDAERRGLLAGTDEPLNAPEPGVGTRTESDGHNTAEVRPVEVYEHAELLDGALRTAKHRLLIVSPWIRSAVVDQSFVSKLEALLKKRVHVTLVHGLGEQDKDEKPRDRVARETLEALAIRYPDCVVHRAGDTHAKVLIKDSEFYVVTSFNWLSFRGDRGRTFREELGTFVGIPKRVDELYERILKRIGLIPSPPDQSRPGAEPDDQLGGSRASR